MVADGRHASPFAGRFDKKSAASGADDEDRHFVKFDH